MNNIIYINVFIPRSEISVKGCVCFFFFLLICVWCWCLCACMLLHVIRCTCVAVLVSTWVWFWESCFIALPLYSLRQGLLELVDMASLASQLDLKCPSLHACTDWHPGRPPHTLRIYVHPRDLSVGSDVCMGKHFTLPQPLRLHLV